MTTEKIIEVAEMYRRKFKRMSIPEIPMDENRTFESLSKKQALAHAHSLIDGLVKMAKDPSKRRKTGSHLTAIQMIASYSGLYTLKALKNQNRDDTEDDTENPK